MWANEKSKCGIPFETRLVSQRIHVGSSCVFLQTAGTLLMLHASHNSTPRLLVSEGLMRLPNMLRPLASFFGQR